MTDTTDSLGANGPVVVLGAGPAGALLATYLARQGHDVIVYESRPDLRTADIGAGRSINLALAARGIAALADIGVMERVDEITIPMAGRMIHDVDGGQSLQPYGSNRHEVIHSVSRTDLNAILLDAAEATGRVTFHFDHWCRRVDLDDRRLWMTIDDPRPNDEIRPEHLTAKPFGVVFGCDGVNSVLRKAMKQAGVTTVERIPLDHAYKELTLPPRTGPDGKPGFQLDPNALHIWPRGEFMLIALANPEGDFTVTLFMPKWPGDHHRDSFGTVDSRPEVDAFFRTHFPDFVRLTPDAVDQYQANPIGYLSTVRTKGWSMGDRAVLVGDSAHGIVPFHGQGMNLAMESCMHLAAQLLAHPDDPAAAFAAFETERKADADAIADMALDNYIEMRSSVIKPDYLLKRELALELEQRFPTTFKARYGMVMFTSIPYSEAQSRARRQADILTRLVDGIDHLHQVDFDRAERLLSQLPDLPDDLQAPKVTTLTLADEGQWEGDETV